MGPSPRDCDATPQCCRHGDLWHALDVAICLLYDVPTDSPLIVPGVAIFCTLMMLELSGIVLWHRMGLTHPHVTYRKFRKTLAFQTLSLLLMALEIVHEMSSSGVKWVQ